MISQGCYAALRGGSIRLHDQICCTEIETYLAVGNEGSPMDHPLSDLRASEQCLIGCFVFVEFSGHQQPDAGPGDPRVGHGFQQDIQSLVTADESKEEDHATLGRQAQRAAGFGLRDGITEIIVKRMRHELRGLSVIEALQVCQHFFAHGQKCVG